MSLSSPFYKRILANMNEGVIFLTDEGKVFFANDKAGALFGMPGTALTELDRDDLIALCYEGRLDRDQFAADLRSTDLPGEPGIVYELATASSRLLATLFTVWEEEHLITVLLLEERAAWRDQLIARTVMEDLHSPITMASSYSNILMQRLQKKELDPNELNHLMSIISSSLNHSLETWGRLAKLHNTDPANEPHWPMFPTSLPAVIYHAVNSVSEQVTAKITIELPSDLPEIAGNEHYLKTAFTSLLSELAARLSHRSKIVIRAVNEDTYVQVYFYIKDGSQQPVHAYLFDELAFAMTEEIIKRHEGRIWLRETGEEIAIVTISLPLWGSPG